MSVIVKGMAMPKNCAMCERWSICECLKEYKGYESILYAVDDGDLVRADECPLVEVKEPHGRLIDADKIDFRNDAMHDGAGNLVVADNFINGILWLNDCIDRTPTVIEAEE